MKINAVFQRKENQFGCSPCVIEKVITLSDNEFDAFRKNMMASYDFIRDNIESMYLGPDGTTHALLVLGDHRDDGVLIDSSGYDYARYVAWVPCASLIIKEQNEGIVEDEPAGMKLSQ